MSLKLYDTIFGCRHNNYSFPISVPHTPGRSNAARLTGTYVVCLKCTKELPYDWSEMKIVSEETAAAKSLTRSTVGRVTSKQTA
ncbi:MAG: hypothetical protein M3O09_01345 [Acidobacteriota bacterium]|nr:hypothetical protein [Acidobacteriota bacterium]